MFKRVFIASLIAGAISISPALAEQSEARPASAHQVWDEILEAYLVEAPDGVNRFDYGALQANGDDRARLDAYLEQFETLDVSALSPDEQFATWANIYNALTVKHIIGRYPVKSIRSGYFSGPWKKVKTVVGGEAVSLDEIEHGILRAQFDDPRVHYAVNCASYGCPNLQPDAWAAASLDEDLDDAARDYINHPRGVQVRAKGGLQVSSIYKWFERDFGGSEAGVIAHLLEYADEDIKAGIMANQDIKKYDYDWSLNDVQSPQRQERQP